MTHSEGGSMEWVEGGPHTHTRPQKLGKPPDLTKLPTDGLRIRRQIKVLGHQLHSDQPKMIIGNGLQMI